MQLVSDTISHQLSPISKYYTNTQFTDYKIEWKAETEVHFMRKELELDNTDFHTP